MIPVAVQEMERTGKRWLWEDSHQVAPFNGSRCCRIVYQGPRLWKRTTTSRTPALPRACGQRRLAPGGDSWRRSSPQVARQSHLARSSCVNVKGGLTPCRSCRWRRNMAAAVSVRVALCLQRRARAGSQPRNSKMSSSAVESCHAAAAMQCSRFNSASNYRSWRPVQRKGLRQGRKRIKVLCLFLAHRRKHGCHTTIDRLTFIYI